MLKQFHCMDTQQVTVQLHIDGLSLHKSSHTQLWPIQGRITEPRLSAPFVIGLYSGNSKPTDVSDYLFDVIEELRTLMAYGLSSTGLQATFKLSCVICDKPARAYVQRGPSHSGYNGCDKCTVRGKYNMRRVVYPSVNFRRRTDLQFRNQQRSNPSPFHILPVDMISLFPIDYMHSVCLGVMKRLIKCWLGGGTPNCGRLSTHVIRSVDFLINRCRKHLPRDFPRKCRTLSDYKLWKASEFRQFLLYIGPVVLYHTMPPRMYDHFMLLSFAVYIFCHPSLCRSDKFPVQSLIVSFINQFPDIYGTAQMVYNVHSLLHLQDDVSRLGSLDSFSAFPFESHLGNIRRMVKAQANAIQQVHRRLTEKQYCTAISRTLSVDDTGYPVSGLRANFNGSVICKNTPNNCVIIDGRPALIMNLDGEWVTACFPNDCVSVESEKFDTNGLNRFLIRSLTGDTHRIPFSSLHCKCVLLPHDDIYFCIPILHTCP